MSPILTRPVREQFDHDRIIRLLEIRYRRKFEVAINPGAEQNVSVPNGDMALFPDLVLYSQEKGRRLQGTVEVETGESINTLEALSQWSPFARLRVPFFLYVPPGSIDTVRRLCADHDIAVAEIWTYHTALDQIRFTMVHRAPEAPVPASRGKGASIKAEEGDADEAAAAPASAEQPQAPLTSRARAKRPTKGKGAVEAKPSEKRTARTESAPSPRATRSAARPRPSARSAAHPTRKAASRKTVKSVKRR